MSPFLFLFLKREKNCQQPSAVSKGDVVRFSVLTVDWIELSATVSNRTPFEGIPHVCTLYNPPVSGPLKSLDQPKSLVRRSRTPRWKSLPGGDPMHKKGIFRPFNQVEIDKITPEIDLFYKSTRINFAYCELLPLILGEMIFEMQSYQRSSANECRIFDNDHYGTSIVPHSMTHQVFVYLNDTSDCRFGQFPVPPPPRLELCAVCINPFPW